ncbi:MAG: hypothetical protein KDE19_24510 [Caldilineaceae bacterium]|nr:hypothetical protein [Caldilineaceae bacterium]
MTVGLRLLVGLLLLTLAVTNGIVGMWAYGYYLQLNQTRIDPMGMAVYRTEMASIESKRTETLRVLFYGDSRAYMWPAPSAQLPQIEFVNRGIGGQTTAQILARFDAHASSLQPDLVILQAGINDLKTIPLFPDRRDEIVENCKKNLAAMVQRTTEQGATVMVTTIFPTANPSLVRRPFWSNEVDEAIVEVNAYLATLVGQQILLFDSAAQLAGADGRIRSDYSHDLLHLNDAGYAVLNQALSEQLRKVDSRINHVR